MKTDDLIDLLSEDAPAGMPLGRLLTLALALGALVSVFILLLTIGIRPHIDEAIETARVLFKIGFTLVLAITACRLVFRVGRPGASIGAALAALVLPVILMLAGVGTELVVLPPDQWEPSLLGRYPGFCLIYVPLLSVAPFVAFLVALKSGAPANPGLAGAAAGLASGALGAAIYAWHCPDDSPLFVASWYIIGISLMVALGYLSGRRLLRW